MKVTDPVCGMQVAPSAAAAHVTHEGREFFFCSPSCRDKFVADPAKYARSVDGGPHPTPATRPAGTEYTCPMHPEIVRNDPGTCPICGMALEPRTVTLDGDDNLELRDMSRRFWVSAVLAAPILFLAMAEMIPGGPVGRVISARALIWLELILATPVVLWGGWPFFERGWQSIINRSPNMFTLIALGVGTAYIYSVTATLFPGLFPDSFRGHAGEVPVYFEAAAIITVLVLLGQVLELRARSQTGGAIKALLGLAPKTARVVRDDGGETDVPLDQVKPGDRLRVRPGEKIPVDGVDGDGRAHLCREGTRHPCHRRHGQRDGEPCHAGGTGWERDAAGADRPDGERGPAKPRANPASRRPGVGLFRSGRGGGRGPHVRDLASGGS